MFLDSKNWSEKFDPLAPEEGAAICERVEKLLVQTYAVVKSR